MLQGPGELTGLSARRPGIERVGKARSSHPDLTSWRFPPVSTIEPDPTQDEGKQITIDDYRAAMDRAAKAERQASHSSRENAILRAGVPTGTDVGQAFVEKYSGDLNKIEEIHAAAVAWGIWKPEGAAANPETGMTPADQAQVDADRAALQHSGSSPNLAEEPPSRHPGQEGLDAYYADIAAGKSRLQASAQVINRITDAAIRGDDRVLVHPYSKDELGYG